MACNLLGAIIAFIYQMLGMFEITTPVSEDTLVQLIGIVINVLVAVGVVIDPTTSSISDSKQAMTYSEPKKD